MVKPESSTTTTGLGQSSITLLQERFRQLRRAKEMREEKKMSKVMAMKLKPTGNHTSKLHIHPHPFKSSSSSSSSAAAKSKSMMLGFENARFDGRHNESLGASQSRSTIFPSSPSSSSSLSFRHNGNDSHHYQGRNKEKSLYNHHRHEKEKRSLEYYCDIGKFLQANNNGGSDLDEEVVKQYDIVRNVHHVDRKMVKRFDHHMSGCDDIDTSLHL
ncbi:unnamed protein product [Linum trigynum]|uniref:Uncharacterized protein n=1 Tax=Linum trigynum TaxID=586398 RepID=A0AAV2EJU1_9ROSI